MKKFVLLCLLSLPMALSVMAQNPGGSLKAPGAPTPIEYKERSIQDLLYFPFSCITAKMPTREVAWQVITDTFGTCESVNNIYTGLHAGGAYDFTYRGVPIGLCYFDWYDDRTWYLFFFASRNEAEQFYNNMVKDVMGAGIPLTKDKVYGGMSNRRKPVSIFKWVSVDPPVKVREASSANIETADVVGMYKVELGVYKKNL